MEKIIILIDDQHIPKIQDVAKELIESGLQNSNVLTTIGVVTGEIEEKKIDDLCNIIGVLSIEKDEQVYLA